MAGQESERGAVNERKTGKKKHRQKEKATVKPAATGTSNDK